jgi:hypothetical protein
MAMHLCPAAWPIAGMSIVLLIVGAENSSTINVTSRVHSSAKHQIIKWTPPMTNVIGNKYFGNTLSL